MKYKLGDICKIVGGSTPKSSVPEYWDGDVKWITPAELNDDSYILYDSVRKITELGVQKTGLTSFPAGTVILSSRAPIGKVAIAGCEMYCNQGFKNLVCSDVINAKYLYWFLKGKTNYLNSLGRGATFKEISKHIVANIEIELPSFQIQAAIVDILEKVSGIINKRQQQLSTLDDLIKARFVEMFGDLAKGVGGYPVEKIGSLVANIVPGWSANGEARQKTCGEKAVLKVSAVTQGYFKPEEHKALSVETEIKKYVFPRKGDLLFSRANTKELVGATAIIDRDYPDLILSDKLWRVIFTDAMNVYYAKYVLSTEFIRGQFSAKSTGTSGSMFNVSADKFRDVAIPVPPRMLQDSFAVFVRQVDKLKSAIQKSLDETGILFDSLMQQYFG